MLPWLLALPLADSPPPRPSDWLSLDAYHVSRTLPALSRTVETPLNPGLRVGHHHAWFGKAVAGSSTVQAAFVSYDELFWSLAFGGGFEAAYRPEWGLYASLGLRVDYERIFTGRNNFEFEGGRYRQETDGGRGFLRLTLADLICGYSPKPLRKLGLVPALRYAWAVAVPLYDNDDANPWSYTEFGVTLLWGWRSGP
jgi:hypothetical protein